MITATRQHKSLVIQILTASFANNKSVNYLTPGASMRHLMDYSFEVCLLFGKVFITDDDKACALILYPELKKTTLKSIWLDCSLIAKGIGLRNVLKALNREKRINEIRPKERMTYLWFIGVDPLHQKVGIGKSLIEKLILNSKADGRPIYLETSTVSNLPWYERHGFEVYGELDLGYRIWLLRTGLL